jgi:hypothetical protein
MLRQIGSFHNHVQLSSNQCFEIFQAKICVTQKLPLSLRNFKVTNYDKPDQTSILLFPSCGNRMGIPYEFGAIGILANEK